MRTTFLTPLLIAACHPHVDMVPRIYPLTPDTRVLSDEEAAAPDLAPRDVAMNFSEAEHVRGADMLSAWFARTRESGWRVGGIAVYVVAKRENDTVECRTAIIPEHSVETQFVPPSERLTDLPRAVERPAQRIDLRCELVSHPEMHTETTSYGGPSGIPQTRTVVVPVIRNDCQMVPVAIRETRWEWTAERYYVAPPTAYLTKKGVRQGEPTCYAAPEGAVTRVEGKVFVERATATPDAGAP